MEWTRTDAARRWIVVVGLIVGPVLAAVSAALNLGATGDSMRAQFENMAAHAPSILAQDLLETLGFVFVLAALAGSAQAMRVRGGALGTAGAILAMLGIVGFSVSNASGLAVVGLAQLPDQDAAFTAAMAITNGGVVATIGTIGFFLEIFGQLGMLLIIGGLIRARMIPIWPLVIGIVGMIVNAVIGTMTATLIADVLLLAACTWIAARIVRSSRDAWLGVAVVNPHAGSADTVARPATAGR